MSTLAPEATNLGSRHDVHTYGWSAAWRLPPDKTCPDAARSTVRQVLAEMGLPDDFVYAATVVASELGANAALHAFAPQFSDAVTPGMPELWIHLVGHPEPRLLLSVFDADRQHRPAPVRSSVLAESGRGLQVVTALSAEWGCRLTRSRIGSWRTPGKAVWAALPLPRTWPHPRTARPTPTPAAAADALHAALTARGSSRIHHNGDERMHVISVRTGLTVWIGDTIYWQDGTRAYRQIPLYDVTEAAEQIISRGEELDVFPSQPGPQQSRKPTQPVLWSPFSAAH